MDRGRPNQELACHQSKLSNRPLERETMLPIVGLAGLSEARGAIVVGVGDATTGSEVGVGDAISESMGKRTWKV